MPSSRVPIIINNQIFSREEKKSLIKKISMKELDTDYQNKDRNQLQLILKQNQQQHQQQQQERQASNPNNQTHNKSNLSNLRVSNQDPVNVKSPKQRSGSLNKNSFRKSPFLKQLLKQKTKNLESDRIPEQPRQSDENLDYQYQVESPNVITRVKSPISQKYYRNQQPSDFNEATGLVVKKTVTSPQNTVEEFKETGTLSDEYEYYEEDEEEQKESQHQQQRFKQEVQQIEINPQRVGRSSEVSEASSKARSNSQAPSKNHGSEVELYDNAPKPLSLKKDNSLVIDRSIRSQREPIQQISDDCFKMPSSPKSNEDISFSEDKAQNSKLCDPSFPIAIRNKDLFQQYLSMILYGVSSKELMMQPIPLHVGVLQFEIVREKKGLNFMKPVFKLYIEKNKEEKFVCMFAQKKFFNKGSNYVISLDNKSGKRDSELCLGKLRGDSSGDNYNLYNHGENPKLLQKSKAGIDQIRNEHFALEYRYVPCSIGRLRKTKLVIPALDSKGQPQEWKPLNSHDSMIKHVSNPKERDNFFVFVDNPPKWNSKTKAYHYDFKGRVTEASVKNFQIIPYQDGIKGCNIKDFVIQFGRAGEHTFKLDAQYPFSIFQAFGLALTACDSNRKNGGATTTPVPQSSHSPSRTKQSKYASSAEATQAKYSIFVKLNQDQVVSIKEPLMNFYPEVPPFEIFEFLLQDELFHSTHLMYQEFPIVEVKIVELIVQERRSLINRIFEQGEKLNQRKLTIHLACLYFDKLVYLSHKASSDKLSQNELERKASMCVIVASKQDELDDKIPLIREVQKISQFKFNYKECQLEESAILRQLDWNLNYITPLHLVQSLLSLGVIFSNDKEMNSEKPIDEQLIARVRKFANYFADFSMKYEELMRHRPSKLALSCVLCARRYAAIDPAWNPIFTDITGYDYEADDIIVIQNIILALYKEKCEKQIKEKQKTPVTAQCRVSSVLEHNQNIMNDSTVIQSQQKLEKVPSDRQDSASKGMCGLDDYLLDLVPVVSGPNLGRSQSKSREEFHSQQQVSIVRIQPLHHINSKPKNKKESSHKKKLSQDNVNKENQKGSIPPFQQSPTFEQSKQKVGSIDSHLTRKSMDSQSLRSTLNNKNVPKPMLPNIPSNKVPDTFRSSNNVCSTLTAPVSRCTSIYSQQQHIHQQVPETLKQRNQSETNLHSNTESQQKLKQNSVTISTIHNRFFKGINLSSNNSSLTRKNNYQGMFPQVKENHKNPLNIHTATKRLEQIKNKYQSEQIINEKAPNSTKNSRNQNNSFSKNNQNASNTQILRSKLNQNNRCGSRQSSVDEQLKKNQFQTQQEQRKTGIVLEEEELELENTLNQAEILATDITQNFSECVEINPNEQSFIKKPIQSNPKTLINIEPTIKKNLIVENAIKEIYKHQGPINEEGHGRNKKLSNKFSQNNAYRTSGDYRELNSHNNSTNAGTRFSHIKSSSGYMIPQQDKNTSISNLKSINFIQRNISQINGSQRGEPLNLSNVPQMFKQRMIEQYRQVFKGTRSSHTANQSYMKGRRISKQQQFKHNKLTKQKSLSTNKSLASISAQFQINIINAEEDQSQQIQNLVQYSKERESLETQIAQKCLNIQNSNMSSHKNLFDRRSQYIRSEQVEKRSFVRDSQQKCLTKKSSPKNPQSSSLLTMSQNNQSKEDLKSGSKKNVRSGMKSWRKDSDIIQIFEHYHSKFGEMPSSQRSNNTSQYGSHLSNTKFKLFKNKQPKKSPLISHNHQFTTRDNSILENGGQKSKLSLQPISSTSLQAKNLQNTRQTLIPQMKFVSNILNASKELMNNNMILNTNNNHSHITNNSTLSCTNQESKSKILSERGKGNQFDENRGKDLLQKDESKLRKVAGALGQQHKKNQLIRGRF